MNKKTILSVIISLTSIQSSEAAPISWEKVPIVNGQQLPCFAVDGSAWFPAITKHSPTQITTFFNNEPKSKSGRLNNIFGNLISAVKTVSDGVSPSESLPKTEFEVWLDAQKEISFKGMLNNIGGYSEIDELKGAIPGVVIASPSKFRPNYLYQWVRDGAITINSLVEYLDDAQFQDSEYNLQFLIESYIVNSKVLQRLSNPSGSFDDLEGLGEPKFEIDSTPFKDNWGRPQRDGPGLRVITISNYLSLLKKYNKGLQLQDKLVDEKTIYFDIVRPDLLYIMKSWNKNGFDLWEEVNALHLFTSLTQLKALKLGLQLASLYDDDSFYDKLSVSFNALRFYISVDSGYRFSSIPYLIETPALLLQGKRTGLDISSILAVIRSHDLETDSGDELDIPFPVDDAAVLNTLAALVNDMKYRYPINHKRLGISSGFALGRYPEDIYDGYGTSEGNPWFIATATASELVYKYIYNLYKYQKDLIIPIEQKRLFESITNMKIEGETVVPYGSKAFSESAASLLNYADAFMDVIREHVDSEGHMSEQFNKYSGYMEGAEDLTWSYSSFWSSIRWRAKSIKIMRDKDRSFH
ncbi:hypothetical protein OGAPHI_006431 [Ogataea philodendri]|uniref:glucan 1,4-alpha-glucosidase n=1 Tax=Ogataea philodendri TaxID=1378263 RepID=A0A9P8NWI6_9ASCO|nr:uncharacterized protein OGAPHI_006431 [Ogataea philodendri]KAH3661583.1 hypothetical protein OGAPHI_006431 [Ogataea philodendri]